MLSDVEREEIERELAHVPYRHSGCVEALKVVQRHRGWVSDDAVRDLAPVLGMTAAEIDSVATFYNLIFREPVGKHVIMVCDSISCWINNEELLLDYLCRKLHIKPGQTTADGQFTLLVSCCLGHCEQAPAMLLDGEVFGNLTEEKIDAALGGAR